MRELFFDTFSKLLSIKDDIISGNNQMYSLSEVDDELNVWLNRYQSAFGIKPTINDIRRYSELKQTPVIFA